MAQNQRKATIRVVDFVIIECLTDNTNGLKLDGDARTLRLNLIQQNKGGTKWELTNYWNFYPAMMT